MLFHQRLTSFGPRPDPVLSEDDRDFFVRLIICRNDVKDISKNTLSNFNQAFVLNIIHLDWIVCISTVSLLMLGSMEASGKNLGVWLH